MALVRRVDIVGPPAPESRPVGVARVAAPVPPPGGADAPPSSLSAALPAWAGNAEAAAVASKGASIGTVGAGFLFVALGTAAAYLRQKYWTHSAPFKSGNHTSCYAGILVS